MWCVVVKLYIFHSPIAQNKSSVLLDFSDFIPTDGIGPSRKQSVRSGLNMRLPFHFEIMPEATSASDRHTPSSVPLSAYPS